MKSLHNLWSVIPEPYSIERADAVARQDAVPFLHVLGDEGREFLPNRPHARRRCPHRIEQAALLVLVPSPSGQLVVERDVVPMNDPVALMLDDERTVVGQRDGHLKDDAVALVQAACFDVKPHQFHVQPTSRTSIPWTETTSSFRF